MVGFNNFSFGNLNIPDPSFLIYGISGGKCFYLRIGQGRFINILTGADGRFTSHDLADELLLVFNDLPE